MADKELKISVGVVDATSTTPRPTGQVRTFQSDPDHRAWHIIAYEVWMYFGTRSKMTAPTINDDVLKNATVESAIVHARILCDIFRSKKCKSGSGILLKKLFLDWGSDRFKDLRSRVKDLCRAYGDRKKTGSPYQVFHQKALHADQARYPSFQGYDYAGQFKVLDPVIREVVDAIEAIRGPLSTPI
jgi:hypothetical protein